LTDPDHTTSLYHKAQELLEDMNGQSYVSTMVKEMLEANGDTLDLATRIQDMLDQLQDSLDLPTKIRNTLETTQTNLSLFMENVCVGAYKTTLWVFIYFFKTKSNYQL
jgi:galactitol-specific phosphotransferase system IIB component